MSILVVGSIALDTIETPFGRMDETPGGAAIYFSCAASVFSPVNIVGVVGTDFDFDQINFLKSRNSDFRGIHIQDGKTFRWGGRYHKNPNKRDTLFTHLNVFENFRPEIPDIYKKNELVFLANIDPDLQLQVLRQIESPELIVLDTMNLWIDSKKQVLEEVIHRCNIFILNDEESKDLTGESNVLSAGKKLLQMGPEYLIIKKGEHGAMVINKESYFVTPAFPLENVVDPTGAGDSFAGGFLGYLSTCNDYSLANIKKAVVFGNIIASFTVEDFSFTKLKDLTIENINQRIEKFKAMTKWE